MSDASDDDWDDYDHDDEGITCETCMGHGFGIVGVDFDSDDPINGPYDGDFVVCPDCYGSGKE